MIDYEKIEKMSVDKIMLREHNYYDSERVDCLSVDKVTFRLITSPKFSRVIREAVLENCDTTTTPPEINGKCILYVNEDENSPVSFLKSKSVYDHSKGITYSLVVKITFRVSALLKIQEQTQLIQTMVTGPNTTYNISKLLLDELERVFTLKNKDITFQEIFRYCGIDSINMKGCMDIKYIPDMDSEKYMKLLSCARRYRYTREFDYDDDTKQLEIISRSFNVIFSDGNEKIKRSIGETSKDIDNYPDLLKYCKDKIFVQFRVTKNFIDKDLRVSYDDDMLSIDTLISVIRYTHDAFTKFMIFMYSECNFYNYNLASKIINNSNYHLDTKENLLNYAKCCADDTKFTENGEIFKEFFGVKYSNAYSNNLKKFVNMRLSPIIIPDVLNIDNCKHPLVYMYLSKKDMENK